MPRFPITVDGKETEIRTFEDTDAILVKIDDRTYELHRTEDGKVYFMVNIRGTPRSILGREANIYPSVVAVHRVYKSYEQTVQRKKAEAQAVRDKQLNAVAEAAIVANADDDRARVTEG